MKREFKKVVIFGFQGDMVVVNAQEL